MLLLASVLPSIFPNFWVIDILSNFKLQIIISLLLIFVTNFIAKKDKFIFLISLVLIFWNSSFLYGLYIPSKTDKTNRLEGVKIVCINLLSSNNDSKKVIEYIKSKNPDILVLLEYNPKWAGLLKTVTNQYGFEKKVVRNDNFGIGFFSKVPSEMFVTYFDETEVPSIKANLKIEDKSLEILATHPLPPVGQEKFNARNSHLRSIAKRRNEFNENFILVGDLNTSSFSKHFKNLLAQTKLRDSRNGLGIMPTWPASHWLFQTALDHFLVSDKIEVVKRETGLHIGSDHLPIYMEFQID